MNPNYPQGYYQQPYGYRNPLPVPPRPTVPPAATAVKITIAVLAPLLWFIALALPAYNEKVYGIFCLAMGWSMIITGNLLAFFAWFSNLIFWTSFFFLAIGNGRKGKLTSLVLASLSLLLALGALSVTKVVGDDGDLFNDQDFMKPAHPAYGMFVWMFSYLLIIVGSGIYLLLRNSRNNSGLADGLPPMPQQNSNPYPPIDPYTQFPSEFPPEFPPAELPPGYNPWDNPDQEKGIE